MMMSEKIILTDVDGVLVNWRDTYHAWKRLYGYSIQNMFAFEYTKQYHDREQRDYVLGNVFNQTGWIEYLPPLEDAIKYVRKLHEEHGYVLHCITSLSSDKYAYQLRLRNLHNLFGKTAIQELICLPYYSSKISVLAKYHGRGLYWIEDRIDNASDGFNEGLKPIVVNSPDNLDIECQFPRVNGWKQIYEIITQ